MALTEEQGRGGPPGFDTYGNPIELQCEDFAASLMQHEIDHLDGILTLHRADRAARQRAIAALL